MDGLVSLIKGGVLGQINFELYYQVSLLMLCVLGYGCVNVIVLYFGSYGYLLCNVFGVKCGGFGCLLK